MSEVQQYINDCSKIIEDFISFDVFKSVIIPYLHDSCERRHCFLTNEDNCLIRCSGDKYSNEECPWIGMNYEFINGLCINHNTRMHKMKNSFNDLLVTGGTNIAISVLIVDNHLNYSLVMVIDVVIV